MFSSRPSWVAPVTGFSPASSGNDPLSLLRVTVACTSVSPMMIRERSESRINCFCWPEESSISMNRLLLSGCVSGLLALTSFTKSLIRIRVSLRLLKIVTISSRSTPSPNRYQTKLPLCWGSFLSDFGCWLGVGFWLSMNLLLLRFR